MDHQKQFPESRLTSGALFLVHSNFLISAAATSVALSTIILAGLAIDPLPLFIVFSVTLFVYSFNRITDISEDERNVPERATFIEQYGVGLLATGTVLYLLAIVTAVREGIQGAPAMVAPLVVAVLYSVFGLKRILLLKNLLVGLSWGLIVLGVGVYYDVLFTVDILFLFGFITVALTIAAVVFDIKDIEGDHAEGIATIPVRFGPRRTRQTAVASTTLLGAVVTGLVMTGVVQTQYLVLLPFLGYMVGYSLVARTDRTTLFYGFVIDGEHIFLAVLVGGLKLLGFA